MAHDGAMVVLVGHCGPDAWALKSAIRSTLGEVEIRDVRDRDGLAGVLS